MRSIGSLGKFGKTENVDNVYVANVSFSGTTNGARIKTWQVGSKTSYNETYQGERISSVQCPYMYKTLQQDQLHLPPHCLIFRGGVDW